jgi:hypothetical protein
MITELDIWRAANLLIRKHGAYAQLRQEDYLQIFHQLH